jgi:ribosomal protein S6--L-glutamate ligase
MRANNVALAPFLSACPAVVTLGIRSTLHSYSEEERHLLRHARKVFFPTPRYVDVFQAAEKPTFPGVPSYRYQRSRLNQQLLFQYLGWPHPRSRIYFGTRQKERILYDFSLPFLAMSPHRPSVPVQFVEDAGGLEDCVSGHHPVIIQEYVRWDERIRLLCANYECMGVQRYISDGGGTVCFEPVPVEHPSLGEPIRESLRLLRMVHLDDIVIEWGCENGTWRTIEMLRPPVWWSTPRGRLNRHERIGEMIESGRL